MTIINIIWWMAFLSLGLIAESLLPGTDVLLIGLIIVVMAIDRDNGALVSGPDIISRGFVYVRENEDIIESSRELARNIIKSYGRIDGSEWQNMKNRIKDELHRYIFEKIKRNPMILPIIMEI